MPAQRCWKPARGSQEQPDNHFRDVPQQLGSVASPGGKCMVFRGTPAVPEAGQRRSFYADVPCQSAGAQEHAKATSQLPHSDDGVSQGGVLHFGKAASTSASASMALTAATAATAAATAAALGSSASEARAASMRFRQAESASMLRQRRRSLYDHVTSPVDKCLQPHMTLSSRAVPALVLPAAQSALTCKGAELCRNDVGAYMCSFRGGGSTDDESLLGADIETLSTVSTVTLLDRRHLPDDPSTAPQIDAKPAWDQLASAYTSPQDASAMGRNCVAEESEPETELHRSFVGGEAPESTDTLKTALSGLVGQESFGLEERARQGTPEAMEGMLVDSSVASNADGSLCDDDTSDSSVRNAEVGSVQRFAAVQGNEAATETTQVPLAVESMPQAGEFPDWSWCTGHRQAWGDMLLDESDGDFPATTSLART